MALLIDVGHRGWLSDAEIREVVLAHRPDADVRLPDTMGDPAEIEMLAVSRLRDDLPGRLPNLKLVQKLGAGVETIVAHPALGPEVRVARLKPEAPAREIAQYCLAFVLRETRNLRLHAAGQAAGRWTSVAPRQPEATTVGVLGLGHIGGAVARLMRDQGFTVTGWSRSPRQLPGIACLNGPDGLQTVLAESDFLCAILPSTLETRGLLDAARLAGVRPGAVLINVGRGDLIEEAALPAALDDGPLGHAVLDVTHTEPLPASSPLWTHPEITITPHVSGWHLGDALADVAENHRRLTAGEPLLHEVDRALGY